MRIARLPPSRRVWIFDLDNTLHNARARIFPSMHEKINQYLQRYYGVDQAGANAMREGFWRRYGTTLDGLMRHHGEHPARFLRETHAFPELADMVEHENALRHALDRLGGRKLVLSNAPRHYVEEVLRVIGIGRYFDAVYTIEDARYRGKPAASAFHVLLRKHRLDPHRCAFIDDLLGNLRAAHRLGMSTIWVSPVGRRVPFVDLRISSVTELPRRIRP
ncbi:MAG TPA: pyrimidine 5'-nucleotidase [Burkholderiales bacterium]|nr:pyrimidine 5'-nucleotidase [Burkholderiales bacterium]